MTSIKKVPNGNYWYRKGKKWVDTRIIVKLPPPIPKTKNLVVVCEPFVQLPTMPNVDMKNCFHVSDKFLAVIRKGPVSKRTKMGNAYIFGPLFKGYSDYGIVENDAGTIGMVLYSPRMRDFTKKETDILDPVIHDSKKFVKAAHEMGRDVLFNGEIVGGDLTCMIFIHQNSRNEVDGLILENYCMFPLYEHFIRYEFNIEPSPIYTLEFRKQVAKLQKGEVMARLISSGIEKAIANKSKS